MATALGGRMARLERLAATQTALSLPGRRNWTDRDWVVYFERLAAEGYFVGEVDYPVAIALYKAQVEAGDSRPQSTYAWQWLCEMYERVRDHIPGVTEAEWEGLSAWFSRHKTALCECEPGVRDGSIRFPYPANYLAGPRRLGATETIVSMRRLRERHPDLE
jgi:hypothetical protein